MLDNPRDRKPKSCLIIMHSRRFWEVRPPTKWAMKKLLEVIEMHKSVGEVGDAKP